jgi:hypothetical protein
MESQKEKQLRLWKARQEAEGYDVSGVTTLEQAKHFFDKKEEPEPPEAPEVPEAPEAPELPEAPEVPEVTVEQETPKPKKAKAPKNKEV